MLECCLVIVVVVVVNDVLSLSHTPILITIAEGEKTELMDTYHSHSFAEVLNALLTGLGTDAAIHQLLLGQSCLQLYHALLHKLHHLLCSGHREILPTNIVCKVVYVPYLFKLHLVFNLNNHNNNNQNL